MRRRGTGRSMLGFLILIDAVRIYVRRLVALAAWRGTAGTRRNPRLASIPCRLAICDRKGSAWGWSLQAHRSGGRQRSSCLLTASGRWNVLVGYSLLLVTVQPGPRKHGAQALYRRYAGRDRDTTLGALVRRRPDSRLQLSPVVHVRSLRLSAAVRTASNRCSQSSMKR